MPSTHPTRRTVLKATALGTAAAAAPAPWAARAAQPSRPNVVVIVTSGLGARDLAGAGSRFHETPHLDRLAGNGVVFSDAYAAAPNGTPSRASILTGKYPASVLLTSDIGGPVTGPTAAVSSFDRLPLAEMSYARVFRSAGYRTWHLGLWGLGPKAAYPTRHGFQANVGGFDGTVPASSVSPFGIPTLSNGPAGEHLVDRLAAEAEARIMSSRGEPFCLNLWFYAPGGPLAAPPSLVSKYEAKAARLGLDPDPIEVGEPFLAWHRRGLHIHRRTDQSHAGYAAVLEQLDAAVGRVLAALERSGNASNTLVVVTSDRGGRATGDSPADAVTSNAPFRDGAGWIHEGGIRVPLILAWAGGGVAGGRTVMTPVTSPDIYPTLLDAAGLAVPVRQPVEGVSLLPAARGNDSASRPIFWHYPHWDRQGGPPASAVRRGHLKLIQRLDDHQQSLYDVVTDPGEELNLMRGPAHQAEAKALRELLHDWREQVAAVMPRPNPWPPFDDLPDGSQGA